MNALLLQIILARRNDELEGWMQILVFVVLAAFWLVGGIIKVKAIKSKSNDKDNIPHKPFRKPPLHSREAREQMLRRLERPAGSAIDHRQQPRPTIQKPRMKFSDLQAAVRKFAAEAEKAFEADTNRPVPKNGQPLPVPKSGQLLPVPQTKTEKPILAAEPLPAVVKPLEDKQAAEPVKTSESKYLSELLTDYANPDELRRAIMHYEILGKPLSLRDTSEHSAGL